MDSKLRKKDTVLIISGRDRGKKGEVLKVLPAEGSKPPRVLVTKVNVVTLFQKPRPAEPGGIQRKEAPLAASNVMLLCPKCQKAVRPKRDKLQTGEKVRACRKCGEVIL